jgi:rhomboid protease GluP
VKISLPGVTLLSPTTYLVGVNVRGFLAMALSGASRWEPQSSQLMHWGANFGPLTMGGQWWRLLTSMFVHVGAIHLLVNMWGLWVLGRVGEYLYGNWRFVALYLLSGLGGSVASLARDPMVVSAGASGALFGVAGALVATSLFGTGSSPLRLTRHAVRSLVLVIAANLAFGFVYTRIDNGAHIGGLITGFLLGAVISLDFRSARQHWRVSPAMVLFPLAGVLIAGSAGYVHHFRGPEINLDFGRQALQHGDAQAAIQQLQLVVESRPNNAAAHQSLGTAYALARQPSLAQKEYARALELDPSSIKLRKQLAIVEAQTGHAEAAVQVLKEAAERSPGDAEIFFDLGVLYQQTGDDEKALPQLQKAAALNPNFPAAFQALGITYLHLRQYEQASEALQQAYKLAPQNADILMALANAYEGRGMSSAANQAYEKAYELRHSRRRK